MSRGFPLPDPLCTPGAINPTLTVATLKDTHFRTDCVRDCVTSAETKKAVYRFYNVPKPANNVGQAQTCELDHLVSLEIGGADSLDNIWPQCGPADAVLAQRFFKIKDSVENYLAYRVRTGAIPLAVAQKGIAEDWTQYLAAARKFCPHNPKTCGTK